MPDTPNTTRRSLLALVGSVAVAGCSDLPQLSGDASERTELNGAALRKLVARGASIPPQTLPVDIDATYLDDSEVRVRELLDSVPSPLGEDDVPNGVVRERLGHEHEHAMESLERAAETESPYERMTALQDAREQAQFAAATWRAIDGDLTRADVLAEADTVRQALTEFREQRTYVGDDPVRGVVVHEAIETDLRGAANLTENFGERRTRETGVLAVGELAGRAEWARALVKDTSHLYEQYTASLAEEHDLRATFESVRSSLAERVEGKVGELPDEDAVEARDLVERDIEGTPTEAVLRELYRDLSYGRWSDGSKRDAPATDVVRAHEYLSRYRAFETVRLRIEQGEDFTVESVADVEAYRTAALDAVSTALSGDSVSPLTRQSVVDTAWRINYADDRLADVDVDDDVRASGVQDHVVSYVIVAAVADATPPVSAQVEGVLHSA